MLRDRFESLAAWLSFYRTRLLVVTATVCVVTTAAVWLVVARADRTPVAVTPTTLFPMPPPLTPGTPVVRPEKPGYQVPAEGACLDVLTELRDLFDRVYAGVQLAGDDVDVFNELNALVDTSCPAEVAVTFRAWELSPWLQYVPAPDVVAGRPATSPAPR